MTSRIKYSLLGLALSVGSPAGMLLMRVLSGGDGHWRRLRSYRDELRREPLTYAYLSAATAVAFGAFGQKLGGVADALEHSSRTDSLTGLRNARAFTERLTDAINHAARYGDALSVLIVDVDHLKTVNDTYGHAAGNATLRSVADAFRDTLRAADAGFRWGGDEFAVIAPHTAAEDAVRLAERIMSRVERVSELSAGLSVSIGIASIVPDPQNVAASSELLVQQADAALYRAKQDGRSCFRTAGVSA